MKSFRIKVGPNTVTGVLIRRENRDRHIGRMPRDGNRDRGNVSTSQGVPRIVSSHLELGRKNSFPQPLEGCGPANALIYF